MPLVDTWSASATKRKFRQQIFLTRSREAAKNAKNAEKKLFMDFPRLRMRKILQRRNSDFFAFFAASREKYIYLKRRDAPVGPCGYTHPP
jgi:hypothetical protein